MKLSPNFNLEKYGLKVNLVSEDDASFIVSLRSNLNRTQYMLTLDSDIEQQKSWIRDYKKREKEGTDYYLIFRDLDGNPRGLSRISYINYDTLTCKESGWIKKTGPGVEGVALFVIHKEIIFDVLKLKDYFSDIHKDNKNALKYYADLNQCIEKEENGFYFYKVDSGSWKKASKSFYEKLNTSNIREEGKEE